jgi:hypothetical protein
MKSMSRSRASNLPPTGATGALAAVAGAVAAGAVPGRGGRGRGGAFRGGTGGAPIGCRTGALGSVGTLGGALGGVGALGGALRRAAPLCSAGVLAGRLGGALDFRAGGMAEALAGALLGDADALGDSGGGSLRRLPKRLRAAMVRSSFWR